MPLLHKSPDMQQIFSEPPIIAYRRDRNLNDILVHGKHNRIFKTRGEESDSYPDKKVCDMSGYCPRNNCKTTNVIYDLYCEICKNVVYVGETERTVGERKEHLADIRHKRDKAVAIHFSAANHSFKDHKFVILERCMAYSCYYRRARERFWMERLNTITPNGINRKSQFGILWPDFMFERDLTHDISAVTSQETGTVKRIC